MSIPVLRRITALLIVLFMASCSSSPVTPENPSDGAAETALRTTPVTGFIELPVAGPTPPAEFTILTAAGSAQTDSDGSFVVSVVDTDRQQLTIAKNAQGNSFALAYGRHKQDPSLRISARSTGLSLVMLNPMFLYASDVQRDSMMAVVRRHHDFNALEGLVFKAWKENPDDPLDPEVHPDLFETAAQIAHDVYGEGDGSAGRAALRARTEPLIRDAAGTQIRFENDMCVNFGAGIRPAGGGDEVGTAIWSKEKAIRLCWCWPPWVEVAPEDTDYDLGYGRFVAEVSKGFHGSWANLDTDTGPGTASLWNLTKGLVLTMDLLAGISGPADWGAGPALTISSYAGNGLQTALTEQDTWSTARFVFDIIIASAENVAYWYWQDATTDAQREFVRKAHGIIGRVANAAAWVQLGWDAGNKALPFFYDLVTATSSRTYYLIHDESGLIVTENFPPDRPDPPAGPANAYVGRRVTFRATTVDPDGEDVSYRLHWGDGEVTEWSGFIASGDTISLEHAFSAPGLMNVAVEAIDTNGIPSELSDPLAVRVRYLPVVVDIFPQRFPNVVRAHNGIEWLHVVGSDTLDVREIDPASILVGVVMPSRNASPESDSEEWITAVQPIRWRIGDMSSPGAVEQQRLHPGAVRDGIDDLILAIDNGDFRAMLDQFGGEDQMVRVLGRLGDGTVFEGRGTVAMEPRWSMVR